MKFDNFDKRYLKISLYIILTVVLIKIADLFIGNVPNLIGGLFSGLGTIWELCLPVIIALCFAYILSWPTNSISRFFQEKMHWKRKGAYRGIAILITYLVTIGIFIGILLGIYYMIGGQLSNNTSVTAMIEYVRNYIQDGNLNSAELSAQIKDLNIPLLSDFSGNITSLINFLQDFFNEMIQGLTSGLLTLGSNIFTIVIAFILSIYLVYSSDYFLELWRRAFFVVFRDSHLGKNISRVLNVFNYTFSNYIRGQLIEALFVAVLISVVLMFVGVDYALVIGVITGILNLIPYIGAFIGVVLATFMGLLTGGGWMALLAFICSEGVQQLDANVLCPRIVGNKVGIHPAFILIAITIGGSQWGLLGMILAVPTTASFITLVKIWYRNNFAHRYRAYRKSHHENIANMIHDADIEEDDEEDEPTILNDNPDLKEAFQPEDSKGSGRNLVKSLKEDLEDIMGDDNQNRS